MTEYYNEFCCRSGGSNLNAGTLTGNAADGEPSTSPLVTYTSGTWVAATGVFTVASGNPVSAGVAVGHWVSVYADGASAPTGFVGEVTARDATTITVDVTGMRHGTAPTNGTNTRTLKVGGAWSGPTGASGFPMSIMRKYQFTLPVRINFKNDQTYNITATMSAPILTGTSALAILQGYTTTYGDKGKATIDGGTSGASYALWNNSTTVCLADLIFQNNGATGSATGVEFNTVGAYALRVVVRNLRGAGLASPSGGMTECEAYDCNQSNTAGLCGLHPLVFAAYCISHHNTGSNAGGFVIGGFGYRATACVHCISDSNGGVGFNGVTAVNCDAYNNGSDGFLSRAGSGPTGRAQYWENCNSINNGGWGFDIVAGSLGSYTKLRYGAGTMANTSGGITVSATAGWEEIDEPEAYPADVTPWADPDTGDFRIVLSEAMGTGRGEFTQEYVGFSDVTTMYPDIGACWHKTGMRFAKRMEGGF